MKSANHYKNVCQIKEIINYCVYEGGGVGRTYNCFSNASTYVCVDLPDICPPKQEHRIYFWA